MYVAAGVLLASAIFYGIFASGEVQDWAETRVTEADPLISPVSGIVDQLEGDSIEYNGSSTILSKSADHSERERCRKERARNMYQTHDWMLESI